MNVGKTFEKVFPPGEFVQFIEDHYGRFGRQFLQAEVPGHRFRPRQHQPLMRLVIPIQIMGARLARGGCLAHLPGTGHKGHLPMLGQMLGKHDIVDSGLLTHAGT